MNERKRERLHFKLLERMEISFKNKLYIILWIWTCDTYIYVYIK